MTEDKLTTVDPSQPETVWDTVDKPVRHLRPVQGMKGPPGSDFLSGLSPGTVFSVRDSRAVNDLGWVAHTWEVVEKTRATVVLFNSQNGEDYVRVVPALFCKRFEFLEVLKDGEQVLKLGDENATDDSESH